VISHIAVDAGMINRESLEQLFRGPEGERVERKRNANDLDGIRETICVADYRNPTLAALLKDLGFVERFGLGIAIARQTLQANGNPAPEFTPSGTHVHVTVRSPP
jgi:predicted HTH transcriptional regulator